MVEKLEGLSAKDRQLWEQKYQDRLTGKAPEEIERLWRDSRFAKKFRGTPEYKWMSTLSEDERDELYNKDYIKQTKAANDLNTSKTIEVGGKPMLLNQLPTFDPKTLSKEKLPSLDAPIDLPAHEGLIKQQMAIKELGSPEVQKATKDFKAAEQQYIKTNPEYLSAEWYKRLALKVAEETSPVYRKYKLFEWFKPSNEQLGEALKTYEVTKNTRGEEEAAQSFDDAMAEIAFDQEPYSRKFDLILPGMGALVYGGTIVLGGMLLSSPEAFYDAAKNIIEDDKGIRFDQAFINALVSNPMVEYGAKTILYGTPNPSRLKYIEEELGGLPDTGFAEDRYGSPYNKNFLFQVAQQHGFTLLSVGQSAAASAVINKTVGGMSKIAMNKLSKKYTGKLLQKKIAEATIKYNKINSTLLATAVPFIVAGTESGLNGYETKEQLFNELNLANLKAYMDKVMSDVAEQELKLNLSRGATEGQSFVSGLERQIMEENAKLKYLPEYLQGEAHAEALAIQAMGSLFYTTSFVNGAANATFLRGLQATRVQNALNNSKLFSKISKFAKFTKPTTTASGTIGNAAVKTVTPTWLKVGAVVKQPTGEYAQEYLPAVEGMATADAKRYNMTEFLDKTYNSDIELEIGQTMEGLHKEFMRGLGSALVSEEANTQGVYGAVSSVIGGPMIRKGDYTTSTVDRDGKMKTKFSLARREGEGKLEYASRLMPWQSGVAMEVRAQINEAKAAKKEAELLLLNLNDPELAARLKHVKTSMAWGKDMVDAAEAGDEFAYRNSEQGRAIQDAILLNKIKDTDLGKAHVSTMKRQALMEMNSPDAVQYIKEVKANPDNLSDGMTDELIVEQGKKNATRHLENLEFVSKETETLNKQLGNVSDDVLSTLIYGRSQLQNWEKRAESLDKEITAVNIKNPTVSSPVNTDLTNVLKLFGSHKNMVDKKVALEKGILAREQSLKDYTKTHKKLTKPQLQAIDRYRLEIKSKKEELKAINALEKTVEGESLMNEHDILRAPADLRAHMLNPENKNSFTTAQLKVIEKVVEQGLAHSPEFLTKVQDAGKISEALGLYYSQYTQFLNNPGYLISYAERARLNKENAVFESNAQKLANIDNYEMFASELDDIFNAPKNSKAVITKSTLDKISKDNPNHFYHKYKKDRTEFMGVLNSAIRSSNNEEMSEDDVAMLANAVKFLQANNIDLKDSSKIVEVMTAVDANGVNIFQDFMENQPKTSLLATKEGTYTNPEDIITKLKVVLDKYNKELEDLKSKDPKIVATETPASANITPVVPVVDVPKAPNNVTPGSNTELDDTPVGDDPQTPAKVSEAAKQTLKSGIETVEKTVKAAPKLYSKEAKERIIKDFSKITERLQASPDATLETLMSEISKLQADYALLAADATNTDENTMYNHAGMLAQAIFTNLQALHSKQQNSIFDKLYFDYESVEQAQSPDAASIEVLNIAYLKRRFSNVGSSIVNYLNIYKVEEFLARNFKLFNPKGKTKIKFMYDPKLAKDVKLSMEEAGKEYDLNAVPIVAVTLVREKTPTSIEVKEGGKTVYYQPIGILPSTTNPYAQGANRTKYLREQLPANFSDLATPTLLVDEEGNTIATTFSSKIHAKSPEKTNDRNIADVIVGQLNNTPENEELKSLNKKDRLKNPLYKSIRDAFIKRFVSVKTGPSSTRLAFTQSNLNFGDDNDIKYLYVIVNNGGDITQIEERNSDTKLVDLFLQENVDKKEAINSNSRVEKFAFKLKLFIQKDFSKHTISVTVNSETGEVSATDSSAEIKKLEESLTNSLNHVIFAKGSWTYTITPTDLVDANNNRLFNLSLTNQEGQDISIPLGQISKSELSIDSQFEILQNIFKAAASQQAEFKFQVDYSDANIANSETATPKQKEIAFKNMQDMFDDGLFLINQTSTEFQITGFTMHSPYTKDGEILKTNEVVTTPTVTDKTIISPNGEKVDSETMVADAKTTSTETKDAEVNNLLLEQQKHSILFKLSDDGKYYINTKTGELFINLDYNEQDAGKQDVRVNEVSEAQKSDIERSLGITLTDEEKEVLDYLSGKKNQMKDFYDNKGLLTTLGRKLNSIVEQTGKKIAEAISKKLGFKVEDVRVPNNLGGFDVIKQYQTKDSKPIGDYVQLVYNYLNAKYDTELAALESKTTTSSEKVAQTSSDIEAQKADIERRRQEELNKKRWGANSEFSTLELMQEQRKRVEKQKEDIETLNGDVLVTLVPAPLGHYSFRVTNKNRDTDDLLHLSKASRTTTSIKLERDGIFDKNGKKIKSEEEISEYGKKELLEELAGEFGLPVYERWLAESTKEINEINAKYDAELKALQQTTSNQSKIEVKKADIERKTTKVVSSETVEKGGRKGQTRTVTQTNSIEDVEGTLVSVTEYGAKVGDTTVTLGGISMTVKEFKEQFPMDEDWGAVLEGLDDNSKIIVRKIKRTPTSSRFESIVSIMHPELGKMDLGFEKNDTKYDAELKASEAQITSNIKPGVSELFESNPELANIGTPEQYSQYLNTIFPNSKLKDIVYHGTDNKFDKFDENFVGTKTDNGTIGRGFYVSKSNDESRIYGNPISVIVNIDKTIDLNEDKNIKIATSDNISNDAVNNGYDSSKLFNTYVLYKSNQIHILGSKQDIEGFKEFVKGTQETTLAPKGTINVYWGQKESESSTRILSNLAPRKFTYEGREYGSVEHAYQSNKSGSFDQITYDKYVKVGGYGTKIRGNGTVAQMKAADSLGLMKKLVVESFKQNPNSEAAKKLVQYENFTHNTNELIDKAFLEGLKLAQTELLNSKQVQSVKIVETTNIISLENTRIAALYDKINNLIKIDRQLLKQKYQEKAWTNPRKLIEILDGKQIESHAQPLSADLFKSYEEWELFVINHEYQHSLYSRQDFNKDFPNKTKGDYESEINRRALLQLNLLNNLNKDVSPAITQIDTKKLLLSLQMLGLNNLKKNFKISGQVLEGKNSFKVLSKADFIATTPDGKIVLILDATKHTDNIEEKLNMQKELLEQNAKFKVATLYKADVNGKLTEVSILNSTEMAELSKNKIKQLNKSELTNVEEAKSPSIVTKPVTVEDNLLLKINEDKLKILNRIEELKQELDKKIQEIKNKPVLETTNTTDTKNMEVVGYANSIYDNKLSNITSTPQENETTFVIKKGKNGVLYLDVYEGAHKRILANPGFVDGTEKQVLNNATQVSVNLLGEVSKNLTTGEYIINKTAKVSIDNGESLKSTNSENNSLNLIDAIKEDYKTKIESEQSKLKKLEKAEAPTTTKEANTNNSTETLDDMVAGLDMFADLGIADDLMNTPTSSISEFAWNNLKNLVLESGETMNEAEVKKMLESTGITELIWNNMTDQMRENTLRCKGFL